MKNLLSSRRFLLSARPIIGFCFLCCVLGSFLPSALYAGSIKGWGSMAFDSNSFAGSRFTTIAAGGSHSLALKSDGSIVGWGNDTYGQATPPDGNALIAIAAGGYHSLALKSDGSIIAWGRNNYGEATPPDGNNFIAIAAGGYHSLALKSDGSIVGWGNDTYGQATPPDGNALIASRQEGITLLP
jgi:alpha-tubulin suppressor-like RCC1 family protein